MRSSRSERLRKDFASVYTPRNDAFSFLTNFFPAQGEPAGLFVPRPAIRFSLPHEGPRATIYGISAAYQGGPFSSGDVAARSARKSGDAMATSSASGWMRNPFQTRRFYPTIKRSMIIFTGAARDPYALIGARRTHETVQGRKTKTLRGRKEKWMRVARWRSEEKGKEKGMEERHILCGHSRFSTLLSGNASSLDPRPRGQRKELVNVNLLMASAPGPFWEFRLLFFFFLFFRWIIATETAYTHIHACVVGVQCGRSTMRLSLERRWTVSF